MIGVLLLSSLLALVTVKCSTTHPKLAFAVFFVLTLVALVAVAFFAVKDFAEGNQCALTNIFYEYYLITGALYALIVLAILFLPLFWVQRFTNSPGNLAWPVLFLLFAFLW